MRFTDYESKWAVCPEHRAEFLNEVSSGKIDAYTIGCTVSNILREYFESELTEGKLLNELSDFIYVHIGAACKNHSEELYNSVCDMRMRASLKALARTSVSPELVEFVTYTPMVHSHV